MKAPTRLLRPRNILLAASLLGTTLVVFLLLDPLDLAPQTLWLRKPTPPTRRGGTVSPRRLEPPAVSRRARELGPAVAPSVSAVGVAMPALTASRVEPSDASRARPSSIDSWRVKLADPSPDARRRALRDLGKLGDPAAALEAARAGLHDGDESVRAEAAFVLGTLGDRAATASLVASLTDASLAVRAQALDSLYRLGDPAATSALESVLANGDFTERRKALRALAALGGVDVAAAQASLVTEAGTLLTDTNPDNRREGVKALRDLGDAGQLPLLENAASDSDASVREKVAEGLGRVGGVRARSTLERLTQDPDRGVQKAARASLAALPGS